MTLVVDIEEAVSAVSSGRRGEVVAKLRSLARPEAQSIGPLDQRGGGKVGAKHPATSRKAATTVKANTQKAWILAWLHDGRRTSAELAPLVSSALGRDLPGQTPISRNQIATRVLELREAGLVEESRYPDSTVETRATEGENVGTVWRLTDNGWTEAIRLRNIRNSGF